MSRKFFILAAGLVSAAALVPLPTQGRATESEVVLNLDPSLDNPRNSEGAFVALKSGSSLFPVEPPPNPFRIPLRMKIGFPGVIASLSPTAG